MKMDYDLKPYACKSLDATKIMSWCSGSSDQLYLVEEWKVLFNNAFNTFYLQLYGTGHIIKDQSESKRGNPLPMLHYLIFLINSKGSFICTIPQTREYIYNTVFVTAVVENWLDQEIAWWVYQEGLIWQPITPQAEASLIYKKLW